MLRSPYSPPALMLVLLMAVGSIVMWIGVPLGLVYAASQLADSSRPSVGPYLLILIGLPIGMAIVGKLLGWLDRLHGRLTGRQEERRRAVSLPCRRSSQPSSLPTMAIPIGSPIRISRYGPTLGRDESASREAAYTRPSGTPIHMTIEPTAINRTSIRAGGE